MNLIDQVARLKEQHAAEASATYQAASDEFRYECDMLNAAPALLEVLGGFQPGDAGSLDFVLDYLIDDPNDNRDPEIEMAKKVVRRLQAMATKMEEPDAR